MVHLSKATDISYHIERLAREKGLSVRHRPLVDLDSAQFTEWEGTGRIIVLAELERPIWKAVGESSYLEFQKMMRVADSILWVTQGGLMAGADPEAALNKWVLQMLGY